jgi:hypothetical protein
MTKKQDAWFAELRAALESQALASTIAKTESIPYGPVTEMPVASFMRLVHYGAQRFANDRVGSAEKYPTTEDKVVGARRVIDDLVAGRLGRTPAASVDAVTKLARRNARAALKIVNPEAVKRLAAMDAATQAAKLDEILDANPQFREEAAAEIEAKRAAVVNVSMDGIEL